MFSRYSTLGLLSFFVFLVASFVTPVVHATEQQAEPVVPQSREQVKMSFAPVAKAAAPAVVNIYAQRIVNQRISPFMNDPFFSQFFGGGGGSGFSIPRRSVERSLGSGVIVREDGVIVTNTHVVEDAEEIRIILNDRREFPARILMQDKQADLAVIKIESDKENRFPVLPLGNADSLEVGDLVLAIGNPFGVGQTVTSGIISATARTAGGISDYGYFIQTDAAINPGNSGGALVDMQGRLVGINTAIYSRSGGSIGIGFAIPADMVKTIVHAATSGKRIVRPWLGVGIQTVTADLAQSLGMERPEGVIIRDLRDGSPLMAAGLKVGDIILAMNGQPIDNPESMHFRIGMLSVGDDVTVAYQRKGKENLATVTMVAPPETPPRDQTTFQKNGPLNGLTLANLSPAVAEEIGYDGDEEQGVIVMDAGQSTAYGARIFRTGDLLLSINGETIKSVADVKALAEKSYRRWGIKIQRGKQILTLVVQ